GLPRPVPAAKPGQASAFLSHVSRETLPGPEVEGFTGNAEKCLRLGVNSERMPVVSDGEDLVSRARSIFARLRDDAEVERDAEVEGDNVPVEPSANGAATPDMEPEAAVEEAGAAPEVEPAPAGDPPPLYTVATPEETPPAANEQAEPALPDRLVAPEEIPEPSPAPVDAEPANVAARGLPRVIAVAT